MSTNKPINILPFNISYLKCREHYLISAERTYCNWVRRFIQFHQLQTQKALYVEQETKVEDFLNYLAIGRNAASATHNQTFNALVFKL
jgi:hypothetical protein